jgi:DNA-binding GntR family transcriptional regulator
MTPIEARLDQLVAAEGLRPGDPLPAVEALAERMDLPATDIRKALAAAAGRGKFKLMQDGGASVCEPPLTNGAEPFSFSTSAAHHHERLVTTLLDPVAARLPIADDSHPLYELERRAQAALGLGSDEKMTVILRVRHLHGRPLVLHRVYLDAARFPAGIFAKLDFGTKSVLDVYRSREYRLLSRDTVLQARLTNTYEDNILGKFDRDVHLQAVLHAEQRFFADGADDPEPFVLEYMQATYLEHWQYEIRNRPAEASPAEQH